MIESQERQQSANRWTPAADLGAAVPEPRVVRWDPVDHQALAEAWPLSGPSPDELVDRRVWNMAALLAPLLALLCAPVGLCVGLVAAGQIGVGRQRGIGFAVAGIVIGALVPVVVCIGSTVS